MRNGGFAVGRVVAGVDSIGTLGKVPPLPSTELQQLRIAPADHCDGRTLGNGADDRFTVALSLADHPVYDEYRLELMDRDGEILWSARRPGKSLLGDAGTNVSVSGLRSGLYRLRIEGLQPERGELLGEYILKVE